MDDGYEGPGQCSRGTALVGKEYDENDFGDTD